MLFLSCLWYTFRVKMTKLRRLDDKRHFFNQPENIALTDDI